MTAKTWNEVFTRLDAFVDGFSADVRAVADVDGTDEVEVRSLRGQLDDARAASVKEARRYAAVLLAAANAAEATR